MKEDKELRTRIRKVVSGTAARPRLSVFRSNKEIYAQLVDDVTGNTLVLYLQEIKSDAKGSKSESSCTVGKAIAEKAVKLV